jgi:hypothetical protein
MQSAIQLTTMKPQVEKYQYLKRAQKRFLAGTNCKTPELAVVLGERSIEQWADLLREELEGQSEQPSKTYAERKTAQHVSSEAFRKVQR